MPAIHLLNVAPGDCTVIRHGSGRVTMVDVSDGNILEEEMAFKVALAETIGTRRGSNSGMCDSAESAIFSPEAITVLESYLLLQWGACRLRRIAGC